ncbi:atpase aaa : ATPase associated with various cellular activities AAA_3 OS=Pirellula staleyi (strain ATCC 27377 / DSM 6068 / ICPB 4128) GN=Psta_2129 PE=4 SV=1: AAA_3 [Gemmataceae bacterium]|nr:atpase aaa : ATPase associated with various cellular activities AAA_3 OS=Pirellula staleyi (strain ATCC 27377 / DSM 6068 / ICPB 4128) GN=Psta_2129 PE=4 SV=1: AAA_3 [Gemmataceae bacterium]VTU02028.1 atpase aaa : ATPase associated with various cellular activities AAA_3 OS=Pirellula staleyi (strain ATCC 27377 / DSM 6068 / ICPB 4128) GN=Psta_2129 PE=4 SV=1: AAA_3 [Gemmataceae bacterium]
MNPTAPLPERAAEFRTRFAALEAEIGKVIVGQRDTVRGVLTGLFVGGHVLLEGVPGLGKTLLVRTLADALSLSFNRIQFTPDLMPSDVTGTNIITESADGKRDFRFQTGPLFAQIVLADEINRATPKTQSALLEAMQEHSVTVAGVVRVLDEPFFVLATQNPIEQEGTYPLPEAQLDRFLFKLQVPFTTRDELMAVLDRTTRGDAGRASKVMDGAEVATWRRLIRDEVIVPTPVKDYAVRLLLGTHPGSPFAVPEVNRFVRAGGSPRGAQALLLAAKVRAVLDGRFNASFDDVRQAVKPSLRHRVLLNFEAQAENMASDAVLDALLTGLKEREG